MAPKEKAKPKKAAAKVDLPKKAADEKAKPRGESFAGRLTKMIGKLNYIKDMAVKATADDKQETQHIGCIHHLACMHACMHSDTSRLERRCRSNCLCFSRMLLKLPHPAMRSSCASCNLV